MMGHIVLALDELPLARCVELIQIAADLERSIGDCVYASKIHNLYDDEGPGVVEKLKKAGARKVKVDFKLHDIPNTVRARARALANAGADIITVHIPGGIDMMKAAIEGVDGKAEVWGITALTSLSEEEIHLDAGHPSKAVVLHRARMAKLAGLHGVVCSPKETAMLVARPELKGLDIVNPGVRSPGVNQGDQARVDTPANAIKAGAKCIVVGREYSTSSKPASALAHIITQIRESEPRS